MKIALLTDVLSEHSGARAAIKLGEALGCLPGFEVAFFGSRYLLDEATRDRLRRKYKVRLFNKPTLFSLSLRRILKEEKVDVISAHCSLRILISAYFSGIPIVRTDYGTQFPSLNGNYGSWKVSFWEKMVNFFADIYVYVRDAAKFFFCQSTVAISRSNAKNIYYLYRRRVPFIYLGCDNFPVTPGGNSFANSQNILSVSRFVPYKGFHILVEVFRSLETQFPQASLTLVGGQGGRRYLDFLKSLIGNNPRIRLIFNLADEVLLDLYSSSGIYASGTRWEGFGLPFLEASSFGLPVVGFSFFGPANEVVQDGKTGFLAAGTEEFKEKLGKLLEDAGLRERMGHEGVLFSKEFTWNKCAGEYAKIIKEIL